MCRNIKVLFNFDPPATSEEIRAAAEQYVRKVSGYTKPAKANETAFNQAILDISSATQTLLDSLHTNAPHRDRAEEAQKAHARALKRFGNHT